MLGTPSLQITPYQKHINQPSQSPKTQPPRAASCFFRPARADNVSASVDSGSYLPRSRPCASMHRPTAPAHKIRSLLTQGCRLRSARRPSSMPVPRARARQQWARQRRRRQQRSAPDWASPGQRGGSMGVHWQPAAMPSFSSPHLRYSLSTAEVSRLCRTGTGQGARARAPATGSCTA